MQKERAASALAHGLPVPTPPPARTRSTEYSSSRPPASGALATPRPSSAPPGRRMPLAVKLLAGGLGLLAAVYGLTLFRDHKDADAAQPPSAPGSLAALAAPSIAPVPASLANAPGTTTASAALAAASVSAGASAMPMMPHLAERMKSVVAAIHGHKAQVAPGTSAAQPNVAAALLPVNAAPVNAAPADSAVK
ncbi:MAG TPA: hypothetical protein VIK01_02980 [Polyangiaceae bacterium]